MKVRVTVVRTDVIDVNVENTLATEILENFKNYSRERSARIQAILGKILNEEYNVSDWYVDSDNLPPELIKYKPVLDAINS